MYRPKMSNRMNRSRLSPASLGALSDEAPRVSFVWALGKENPVPRSRQKIKIAPRHRHRPDKKPSIKSPTYRVCTAEIQQRLDAIEKAITTMNMGLSIERESKDQANGKEFTKGEDLRVQLMASSMPVMEEEKNAKSDESSELLSLPHTNEPDEREARRSSLASLPQTNEASDPPEQVDKEKQNDRIGESKCKRRHGIAAVFRRHLVDQSKHPSLSFQTGNRDSINGYNYKNQTQALVHLDLDYPCPNQSSRSQQTQHQHPQQRQPRWQRGIHRTISSFLKSSTSNHRHQNSRRNSKIHSCQSGGQKENNRDSLPYPNSDRCQKQEHPAPHPPPSQQPNTMSTNLQKNSQPYYATMSVGAPNYRDEVCILLPHMDGNYDDEISSISSIQDSIHSLTDLDTSFSINANNSRDRMVPWNIDQDQDVQDNIRDAQDSVNNRRLGTNTTFQMHDYDDRGRCVRHHHIRLRRKKLFGFGGWKVLLSACPDCCAEELHRMYLALEDKIRELPPDGHDGCSKEYSHRGRVTSSVRGTANPE
mmetsp:Transcript_24253/g.51960  ORF Transcript_24253/g.51960 Transcript_24253/m.51960 type:complete len:534 (-) Transcript_24253:18-1619(-)